MSVSVNAEFNQLVVNAADPLQQGMLSLLSVRDLASLRASCQVFHRIVMGDSNSAERLDIQKKVLEWAPSETLYVNRGFLSPSDCSLPRPKGVASFSMQTVRNVAKWLREKGDAPISPHGVGAFQPHEKSPVSYILGMDDPSRIYFHLWKVKGSPEGDLRYGEKAFQGEGISVTNAEKAEACERFVRESYWNAHPSRD